MSINYLKNLVLLNQKIKENKNQVRREPLPRIEKESKADLLTKSNLELKAQINQASKNISGVKNKTTKISSPYTAQMIKEYKMNMDKPVIIDSKSYKYHPIKFPESENLGELTVLEQEKQIRIQEIKNDFNDVKYKINVYKFIYERVKKVLEDFEKTNLESQIKMDELQTSELTQDIVNGIYKILSESPQLDNLNNATIDMIRTIKNNQIPKNMLEEYEKSHGPLIIEQPEIIGQPQIYKNKELTDEEEEAIFLKLNNLLNHNIPSIRNQQELEYVYNDLQNYLNHIKLETYSNVPRGIYRLISEIEEELERLKNLPESEGKGIHGGALEDENIPEAYKHRFAKEDKKTPEEIKQLMSEMLNVVEERETEEEIQFKINLITEMKLMIGKLNVVIRNIKLLLTELINIIDTNNIIYNNIETELTNAEQEYLGAKNRREMEERNLKTNISSYEQTIKQLNSNMIISKNPEESEEEYLARLASYGTMPLDDKETLARAQTFNLEIFKNNLREITNNESKIEEVYNHFNSIDPGIIGEFNKTFPLFLDSYKKIFGINNISVKSSDIINFIERFMESKGMDFLQPQQMTLYMPQPIIPPRTQGEPIINFPEVDETETPISFYFEDENNDGKYKLMYRGTKLFFISKVKTYGNIKLYVSETGNKGTYRELTHQKGQAYITTKLKSLMGEEVYNYFLSYLFPNTNISRITIKDISDEIIKRLGKEYNLKDGEEIQNYNTKVPQQPVYGFGINKRTKAKEEYKKVGKIYISPDKLNKNVLSIQNEKRLKIKGLKNKHISDNLADAFLKISNNNNLTNKDINILDEDEKLLLDNILYIAGLHKNISGSGLNSVEKYKNKLNLIVGEIEAGNNNNKIKSDLYDVLFKLVHFGALGEKEARNYYKNILTNYF